MTTAAAGIITADTPPPIESDLLPIDQVIANREKKKPQREKVDLKSLQDIPDVGEQNIPKTETAAEFLARLDGKEPEIVTTEEPKKKDKPVEVADPIDLGTDDLNLDDSPVVEKKGETPLSDKDKNFAALRAKEKAAEESAKAKEAEADALRKRTEELEAELEKVAFEKSPKFQAKYKAPLDAAKTAAETFAKEYGDEGTAQKALSLKGRERLDFIDETFGNGAAASRFLTLVEDVEAKQGALDTALSDRQSTAEAINNDVQEEQRAMKEKINRNFEKVKEHLSEKSKFFKKTGDAEADKSVDARIERVKSRYLGTASEKDLALTPWLAEIAADAVKELSSFAAELEKYKARERENAAVTPTVHRGARDDGSNGNNGKPVGAIAAIRAAVSSGSY